MTIRTDSWRSVYRDAAAALKLHEEVESRRQSQSASKSLAPCTRCARPRKTLHRRLGVDQALCRGCAWTEVSGSVPELVQRVQFRYKLSNPRALASARKVVGISQTELESRSHGLLKRGRIAELERGLKAGPLSQDELDILRRLLPELVGQDVECGVRVLLVPGAVASARLALGISASALAALCKWTPSRQSRIESGTGWLSNEAFDRLVSAIESVG